MSRKVTQTWRAGTSWGEKSDPGGENCCAKAERLGRMCLIPGNKKKFIMAGLKSSRARVSRDEGRHRQEQVMQSLPGLSKVGFNIFLWSNGKTLQGKGVVRFG